MPLSNHTSKGIIGSFYNTLAGIQAASWAFLVSHYNPNSDQSSEEYLQTDPTPQFQPWQGMRDVKDVDPFSLTISNVKYEATLRDFADNFMYDKTGQLQNRISGFARRSVTHWGKLLTDAIKLGETSTGADGAAFFSAAHHSSQNNLLTASDNSLLNVATPANPTAVEMADVIGAVISIMRGWTDTEDEPLNEEAESFHVMLPSNMGWAGSQAAGKSIISDSNGAKDNPLLGSGLNLTIGTNARLTSTTELYVARVDGDTKPCILQERGGLKLSAKAEGSEYEHDTDKWEFGAKTVRGVGLYNWENMAKVTLS